MRSDAVVGELTSDPRPTGSSSFLCERWWCILLLEVFNFHPIGSMARVPARAIVVYSHGAQNKNKVGVILYLDPTLISRLEKRND